MAMSLTLTFNLWFATRYDQEANVHVGYCPMLSIYSQGRNEREAEEAVVDAAKLFIIESYKRNSLGPYLRSCGMTEAAAVPEQSQERQHQYIRIEHYENQFERDVPIELLVAKNAEASTACR